MKVLVVGAGLGGLACAIACRKGGLQVVVLEKANRIMPEARGLGDVQIGSGIQVPPNAARVARQLGYLDKLLKRGGGVVIDSLAMRRYADGRPLCSVSPAETLPEGCGDGDAWMVVHRADYHAALWETCVSLGVDLCLDLEAERIDFETGTVYLEDGDDISGDVVVGADGLYSVCRDQLLGTHSPAVETGDLMYRATIPLESLQSLRDARVEDLCARNQVTTWLGPQKHAVFYPVRGGREFNLALLLLLRLGPDDTAPPEPRPAEGDHVVGEMKESFAGWDETLTKLVSSGPRVQKWKPRTHPELQTWTKGCVALLGDSCHPSLPYQAQGAAMAVEDGAVLGKLLGLLSASSRGNETGSIPEVLRLYETLRKSRSRLNARGTTSNREWYHVPDGPGQEARDAEMAGVGLRDGLSPTGWCWIDPEYQRKLWGHDSVAEAAEAFGKWEQGRV